MTSGSATASVCRIVVLISGNGSNLQALIDYPARNYDICCVISNRPDTFGLERASKVGIKTVLLDHKNFDSRESFDQSLMELIDSQQPDLVVLAGFMRILSSGFVQHYAGKLLNIHPSLLPLYKGTHTHQRVLDAGDTEHGVSVHFVTEELDGGPVIVQAMVPVIAGDNKDSLAQRVAIQEHKIYPEAVVWFAQGRLEISATGVCLDGKLLPACGIQTKAN
jgi:phosphoribosylglycinamide formyltransferase-1